jgi:hypothetical protein
MAHLLPDGNRQAVDKLDGLENATIRNPDATNEYGRYFTLPAKSLERCGKHL